MTAAPRADIGAKPITFPRIATGHYRNAETGVEIKGGRGAWRIIAAVPDSGTSLMEDGFLHAEETLSGARGWATQYVERTRAAA